MAFLFKYLARSIFVFALTLSAVSHAASDRPLGWEEQSPPDLKSALQALLATPKNLHDTPFGESELAGVLKDEDGRILPEFRVPVGMEASVFFWLKIYGVYSSQQALIYDRNHPEIVYEALDFRELARTSRNAIVYEILSKRKTEKALALYRTAFSVLSKNPRKKNLTREEQIVVDATRGLQHRHSFKELGSTVRVQTGQRDQVIRGILASDPFMPKMESIFDQLAVPRELLRITLVESSFNLRAVSTAGAAGVWQFIPTSAREYMMIDPRSSIDERLSPLKSTVAAAKLLKRNYRMLKSWPLAISAYNHGHGKLRRAEGRGANDKNLWRIFSGCPKLADKKINLGYASRSYFAEFLAMLHAESYRDRLYGGAAPLDVRPITFVQNTREQTPLEMMMAQGISLRDFQEYNPDVRLLNRRLPKGFWFALPGNQDDFAGLWAKSPRKASSRRT